MTPPLFAVESKASREEKTIVNLLPCRIHHDGDVNPSKTFWNPTKDKDGIHTAYLRGRKLHGKAMRLPKGYQGVVVEKTDAKPETPAKHEELADVEIIENPDDQLEVGTMRVKAGFDGLMIWGHESTTESVDDPYVRGMEEWIAFAEEIHSYSEPTASGSHGAK
ncbi:ribonuclease H1 small subunit [Xylaria sp. CBS 124048]|nr:ribonuclease H1 small subunit [Xylaria sp. CBS 124048]